MNLSNFLSRELQFSTLSAERLKMDYWSIKPTWLSTGEGGTNSTFSIDYKRTTYDTSRTFPDLVAGHSPQRNTHRMSHNNKLRRVIIDCWHVMRI